MLINDFREFRVLCLTKDVGGNELQSEVLVIEKKKCKINQRVRNPNDDKGTE
jgi:hypothetical protein